MSGRFETLSDEALRIDLFYIENCSVGTYLFFLAQTEGALVPRVGGWVELLRTRSSGSASRQPDHGPIPPQHRVGSAVPVNSCLIFSRG